MACMTAYESHFGNAKYRESGGNKLYRTSPSEYNTSKENHINIDYRIIM